jgi:hypothetical protein
MTIYYRDDTVLIDSESIEVAGSSYPLRRLGFVWHRRVDRFRVGGTMLATRIGAVAAAVAVVVGAGFAVAAIDLGRYTWLAFTVVALLVTALAALAGFGVDPLLELLDQSHERGHGIHEIWARIGGREVLLLRTPDALRFGKIYRSLQRAIEHSPAPAPAQQPPGRRPPRPPATRPK